MRKIWIAAALLAAAAVAYRAYVVRQDMSREIVSMANEWKKNGVPVNACRAAYRSLTVQSRLSGVYRGAGVIEADVTPRVRENVRAGDPFTVEGEGPGLKGSIISLAGSPSVGIPLNGSTEGSPSPIALSEETTYSAALRSPSPVGTLLGISLHSARMCFMRRSGRKPFGIAFIFLSPICICVVYP